MIAPFFICTFNSHFHFMYKLPMAFFLLFAWSIINAQQIKIQVNGAGRRKYPGDREPKKTGWEKCLRTV